MKKYIKMTAQAVDLLTPYIGDSAKTMQNSMDTLGLRENLYNIAKMFIDEAEKLVLSKDEFKLFIDKCLKEVPNNWRKGQAVFNIIDREFNVARTVQYMDGVDCFYRDDAIDEFIDKAYERYSGQFNSNK